MSRITTVNQTEATGKAKELLDGVQKKIGFAPNMMKTMAQSPAVLEAYLNFNGTLAAHGKLNARLREQLALVSAETNGCAYCASAHSIIGKSAGLSEDQITLARRGSSDDAKIDAALKFALSVIINRGAVGDEEFAAIKAAGYDEAEIAEIIAHVALNAFTNYFTRLINGTPTTEKKLSPFWTAQSKCVTAKTVEKNRFCSKRATSSSRESATSTSRIRSEKRGF